MNLSSIIFSFGGVEHTTLPTIMEAETGRRLTYQDVSIRKSWVAPTHLPATLTPRPTRITVTARPFHVMAAWIGTPAIIVTKPLSMMKAANTKVVWDVGMIVRVTLRHGLMLTTPISSMTGAANTTAVQGAQILLRVTTTQVQY